MNDIMNNIVNVNGSGKSRISGADPGFLVGGSPNLQEGAPKYKFATFPPKNCMKLTTFWSVGGAPLDPPPDFPEVGGQLQRWM